MEVGALKQIQLRTGLSNLAIAFDSIILVPTFLTGSSYMPLQQSMLPEIGTVEQEITLHLSQND